MLELLYRFQRMDRRWVFAGMALSIIVPLLFPIKFDFKVNKEVQAIYDTIEGLAPGTTVLVSADFDPASVPELGPFYTAHVHHLFRKNLKPVLVTLWPTSIPLIYPEMKAIAEKFGKVYGRDWAFLGYKEGKELVIKNIGQNILQQFPKDYEDTPLGDLPIMQGMRQAKDFGVLVSISAGFPGLNEYVLQIQGQYNLRMVGACTAVGGPDYIPFFKSKQLLGLSIGMPGSAQYEKLVWQGKPPEGVQLLATSAMDVLNIGHLFIILLVVFGNIAYFVTRRVEDASDG
ncbi:MAG: hypothetical protein VX589_01525 [Myxococcota bacterium]|nr:hypothetical protein [Myxococcota bacterium]